MNRFSRGAFLAVSILGVQITEANAGPKQTPPPANTVLSVATASPYTAIFDGWDALLSKFVRPNGGVDYQGLGKNRQDLESLLALYSGINPASASDDVKKALYINLYNAGMMLNVLKYAEENKIDLASKDFMELKINDLKVSGGNIWNGSYRVKLGTNDVNLDDIEHNLIRGKADDGPLVRLKVGALDPRIHTAANCAAVSCPRVREKAYRPENIDAMLTENIKEYVNSKDKFAKLSDSKMSANNIVAWYYSDFDETAQNVFKLKGAGSYLAQFIADSTADAAWMRKHFEENFNGRSKVALKFSSAFDFNYDWHVNDIRNKTP